MSLEYVEEGGDDPDEVADLGLPQLGHHIILERRKRKQPKLRRKKPTTKELTTEHGSISRIQIEIFWIRFPRFC